MISTFKADLRLDPETVQPNFISEDRKSATCRKSNVPYSARKFTFHLPVLSSEGFEVGMHYWQVEVRHRWLAVSVWKESFPSDALMWASSKDGCWQIQHYTSLSGIGNTGRLIWVGILLDYELGEVSLYNMNRSQHL